MENQMETWINAADGRPVRGAPPPSPLDWKEWHGADKLPVNGETRVDVRFRGGEFGNGEMADYWTWGHTCGDYDIVAYRLHAANDNHPQEDAFMAKESLRIVEGGWYKRRDGEVVGPAILNADDCGGYPYAIGGDAYSGSGIFHIGYEGALDLVEEATFPRPADAAFAFTTGFAPMRSKPDVKAAIADEAKRIVTGARRSAYGTPEDNFMRIARFWTAYMRNTGRDVEITAGDVSPFMRLMKEARLCETPDHRDSYVDLVGYTLTGAEVNGVAA